MFRWKKSSPPPLQKCRAAVPEWAVEAPEAELAFGWLLDGSKKQQCWELCRKILLEAPLCRVNPVVTECWGGGFECWYFSFLYIPGCVLPAQMFSGSRWWAAEEWVVQSPPRKSFPVPLWALPVLGWVRAGGEFWSWRALREHTLAPAPSLVPAGLEGTLRMALTPHSWVWIL